MADDTSTDQADATVTDAEADKPTDQKADVPPEVKRALSKANKEAEGLRLKLKEYEDRDKTEQQRLAERAEAAERELAESRLDSLRTRVAIQKGVPADLVDRLRGDTEDDLSADADRLLALLQPGKPRGDVAQGPRGEDMALNGDPLLASLKTKLGIS